ncbi:hypothetical protein PIB30_113185, partial [Stylosanthes scabra]|nr:hypothetical protein [Stylosanthes scabra]
MGKSTEPVTDKEHVAFLIYWLNAVLFCSRSVTMQKLYIPLAIKLHESKKRLCLAKLLLGELYHNFGQMVDQLRAGDTTLRSGGPLWIAQLWLNAVFEKFM